VSGKIVSNVYNWIINWKIFTKLLINSDVKHAFFKKKHRACYFLESPWKYGAFRMPSSNVRILINLVIYDLFIINDIFIIFKQKIYKIF
jgi:hypothetical protein